MWPVSGQGLVRWVLWCIILVLPLAVGPLPVGRWSLIGVRAVGVCLYTEARILHFALITALAARARSERRGGVRGKSQNIQIKTEDRQGNDAERSQCQILICPKRPIASVHKPKQEPMKHLEKRMETCTHRSKKIKSRINKTESTPGAAELGLFSPRLQPRIPLKKCSFYTPGH